MSKDFQVTVTNEERAKHFVKIFGSATVYVESFLPVWANLPDIGECEVYRLDMSLLTDDQLARLENYLSGKFVMTEVEVRDALATHGVPILASDCVVHIDNPQRWID